MTNIDLENITFSNPKKGSDGRYFVSTNFNDADSIQKMFFQFNKVLTESKLEQDSKTMNMILSDQEIIEFVQEVEDCMLKKTKELKETWFPGKELSDGYFDTAFMSNLKNIKKTNSKLCSFRTSPSMVIYNSSKEEIVKSLIKEGDSLNAIVQLMGIWFSKTRFGITWRVEQLKTREVIKIENCLFEDVEDDDLDNVYPDE
jgi:hypothetical protein